jgi:hypothetical protein
VKWAEPLGQGMQPITRCGRNGLGLTRSSRRLPWSPRGLLAKPLHGLLGRPSHRGEHHNDERCKQDAAHPADHLQT